MWGHWALVRPDALRVWGDPEVRRRLSWYLAVMTGRRPAKFKLARLVELPGFDRPGELASASEADLWAAHGRAAREFRALWRRVREGSGEHLEMPAPRVSLLHAKAELARRLASPCRLCERRCMVSRASGRLGACRLAWDVYVHSAFLHLGEEAPLVPSGTIFYGGCNFTCVYCQNYDVSQTAPRRGVRVSARRLAAIQDALARRGARNINHVGGDPTPSLHVIMESLLYVESSVPQLWNSNFYMSREAMELLVDVIDIWLPDFKYGNNRCAARLSAVPRYWEVVTRNLRVAVEHGDMIIRHLVLPGHLDCCTRPVLEWISRNLPRDRVLVNVMGQYRPMHLAARHPGRWPEIARRPEPREVEEARRLAGELGLLWEPVS
ncbi:MAG: radical SAM protein [Desulfurococcales archaeon]|nr:radical SAM protein [Desulfurococcales archaeon]